MSSTEDYSEEVSLKILDNTYHIVNLKNILYILKNKRNHYSLYLPGIYHYLFQEILKINIYHFPKSSVIKSKLSLITFPLNKRSIRSEIPILNLENGFYQVPYIFNKDNRSISLINSHKSNKLK